MAYQTSLVITFRIYPCRRIFVVVLNSKLIYIYIYISQVSTIAWLEFELANYDVVVYHVNHYATSPLKTDFVSIKTGWKIKASQRKNV